MGIICSCSLCLLCDDSDEELSGDENPLAAADDHPSITADENESNATDENPSITADENESNATDENPSIAADDNIIATITEDDVRFAQEQLLDREITSFANTHHISRQIPDTEWARNTRTHAVDTILELRRKHGVRHSIGYLTATYFDRILARVELDEEQAQALEYLPRVCYTLAYKMENGKERIRFKTDSQKIKRTEIWVLSALEWRMGPVTPFDFVHYFAPIFSKESPPITISEILDVILVAVMDKDLIRYRPSVIAAAATLVRLDPRLNKEALEPLLNATSLSQFLDIEQVWSCYNQFKQLLSSLVEQFQNRNDGEASSSGTAS